VIRYQRLPAPACLSKKSGETAWRSDGPCYLAILTTLCLASQEHCAFCDGKLGIESKSTVEHFRPKTSFPALLYSWQNLFPACDVCQSAKGVMFDQALLKPDENNYDFATFFQVNHRSGEIEPLASANQAAQLRAKTTIDTYQLNKPQRLSSRKHELKHWRLTPENDRRLDEFSYRYFIDA
jgi:uncharacterized protein (TIGR02646 family)